MLYILSRPRIGWFEAKRAAASEIFPLSMIFGLQVVLPNLSLAYTSVTFYQIARVLTTPETALIDYFYYHKTIPRAAVYSVIPTCLGVGIVSYYESTSVDAGAKRKTSFLGVFFALTGGLSSALYTVWIKVFHDKLQMNSSQLLFNQAPYGAMILLYLVPFADTFPTWREVDRGTWELVLIVSTLSYAQLSPYFQF